VAAETGLLRSNSIGNTLTPIFSMGVVRLLVGMECVREDVAGNIGGTALETFGISSAYRIFVVNVFTLSDISKGSGSLGLANTSFVVALGANPLENVKLSFSDEVDGFDIFRLCCTDDPLAVMPNVGVGARPDTADFGGTFAATDGNEGVLPAAFGITSRCCTGGERCQVLSPLFGALTISAVCRRFGRGMEIALSYFFSVGFVSNLPIALATAPFNFGISSFIQLNALFCFCMSTKDGVDG
jgi:hypothetical protein